MRENKTTTKIVTETMKFWNIEQGADNEPAKLMLYGELSDRTWFGDEVTARDFANDLASIGGKDIEVHINSPGGDVYAGQAIYTCLKNYPGSVRVMVDGMCASAATIVAMAGDTISMPSNGMFMIHNPAVSFVGYLDESQLQKLQNSLKATKQTIVNVYLNKCKNLSEQQIKNMMDRETWMTADVALSNGFIDEIIEEADITNEVYVACADFAKEKYHNFNKKEVINMTNEESSFFAELKKLFSNKETEKENNAVKDAVLAERKRISDLLAMKNGSDVVAKMVDIAIAEGNTPEEIKQYVDAVPAPTPEPTVNKGIEAIKALISDQLTSGAEKVVPVDNEVVSVQDKEEAKKQSDINEVINALNELRK